MQVLKIRLGTKRKISFRHLVFISNIFPIVNAHFNSFNYRILKFVRTFQVKWRSSQHIYQVKVILKSVQTSLALPSGGGE